MFRTGTGVAAPPMMEDDDEWVVLDPIASRVEVAKHLARCQSCRDLLESARKVGPTALDVWRREFAECFTRTGR